MQSTEAESCSPEHSLRQRNEFLDNLKGILIFLVVLGHFLLPARPYNEVVTILFRFIYIFHMPLFVFVTGFFANRIYKNNKLRVNKIISMLLLGVLFQLALILIEKPMSLSIYTMLRFGGAPWYLISTATWYIMVPFLVRLKPVPTIVVSFAISFMTGYFDNLSDSYLALCRTLGYLPFFTLGLYCTEARLTTIKQSRLLVLPFIASCVFVAFFCMNWHVFDPIYESVYVVGPYTTDDPLAFLGRALMFACSVLLCLGVMFITPKRRCFLGYLGKRTLQIYILHRCLRSIVLYRGLYTLAVFGDPLLGTLAIVLISVVVTALCSINIIGKPFTAFLRLRWSALVRSDDDTNVASASGRSE